MKPVRLLCYMFLWTWKGTTCKRIPIILIVLTNKNFALIYSLTICQQKTKDCALSGYFQHKLQHCCFLSLMFAAFHNQSPLITMVKSLLKRKLRKFIGASLCCYWSGPLRNAVNIALLFLNLFSVLNYFLIIIFLCSFTVLQPFSPAPYNCHKSLNSW